MPPGPQLARDASITILWELLLHPRNGRTEVGIGLDVVLVALAWPPVVGTPRKPDHATSSLGGEATGPEMINDRPLLVAGAAMSPLVVGQAAW
jgi:hypothetical protein